jgi:chloramphenicol 3-O phosphotransferase
MPTVVLINGAGSSGKSSIARALQEITTEPFLHVAMDAFLDMLPEELQDHPDGISFVKRVGEEGAVVEIGIGRHGRRLLAGMRDAISALAKAGNNLIVDDVMLNAEMAEYERLLAGVRLCRVGIYATLDVLIRRERDRGDRLVGLARWQHARVHAGNHYDFEVWTDERSPDACAQTIKDRFGL